MRFHPGDIVLYQVPLKVTSLQAVVVRRMPDDQYLIRLADDRGSSHEAYEQLRQQFPPRILELYEQKRHEVETARMEIRDRWGDEPFSVGADSLTRPPEVSNEDE